MPSQRDFASLCFLAYERPHLLRRVVEGAIENAGGPIEVLLHDDGSSEPAVREVILGLLDDGLLSHVFLNPPGWNEGQGRALNGMFRRASGDPIIKCDTDLEFGPGWLSETRRILDDNDRRVVSCAEPRIGLLGLCHYFHDPVDMRQTVVAQWDGWQQHPLILGSAFALRRECWEVLGPFEEYSTAFNEDGAMQRAVTESEAWVCGLPDEELVSNPNMGPGFSTVVFTDPSVEGGIGVAKIHTEPRLIG